MIRESYDMDYGGATCLDLPINYERLKAEPWQLDLLKLNPEYCCWGPGDDGMPYTEKYDWNSSMVFDSWEEFGPWDIDHLNEVVHFYFSVGRKNIECESCGGTGMSPEAKMLNDKWNQNTDGNVAWKYSLSQADIDALWDNGCYDAIFEEKPLLEQINDIDTHIKFPFLYRGLYRGLCRDICVKEKCERLGIVLDCPICNGRQFRFTANHAEVSLILWMLHPRQGASRGIEITKIQEEDLPAIFTFLKKAAKRNEMRFKAIV
ncbi:hypothetical protein [Desulfogranum marinum]|uniref:hypothetical protein n=1 Tax=Desulfogranum marinum TaxID=453220 RepID=UPI001962C632|nr:hypothetical protein [Desulfogranum marinum]MBM9512010.1 hypothetical protein [Desulfogranum marinum]